VIKVLRPCELVSYDVSSDLRRVTNFPTLTAVLLNVNIREGTMRNPPSECSSKIARTFIGNFIYPSFSMANFQIISEGGKSGFSKLPIKIYLAKILQILTSQSRSS